MLTKAYIEEVISNYEVKVRIPVLDSLSGYSQSTRVSDLSTAIFCTLPNCSYYPAIGDVVIVGFEDSDASKPIILGCLFKEDGNLSKVGINLGDLSAESTISLSKNISIGDISYTQLENLLKSVSVINERLSAIENRLDTLESSS